ncbi:MAG: MBL fold metallo-hydrolase [Lachnospiraceae bacterium]
MRMKSLASGSSGNAIYVGSETTHLLIDVGISGKRIEEGLNQIGISCRDLDGILLTHEHSDHIAGLGVISRRYGIPIYATGGTLEGICEGRNQKTVGEIDSSLFQIIQADERFAIKDISIRPLKISHDAKEPVAYQFAYGTRKTAIMTDLGVYDDYILGSLQGMDAVFLEANHDVRMLQLGRYPYPLKQRILGKKGHLSNEASGRLLSRILHDRMQHIVLSHLSQENNLPELAYEAVRLEITASDTPYRGDDFDIAVASRYEPSCLIEI